MSFRAPSEEIFTIMTCWMKIKGSRKEVSSQDNAVNNLTEIVLPTGDESA